MNYKFPEIRTIDDVLPAIEGRKEFYVTDKGYYKVINYHVNLEDTFPEIDEQDPIPAVRRECRGIMFNTHSGRIIRRPFHKFFNLGERLETTRPLFKMDWETYPRQ